MSSKIDEELARMELRATRSAGSGRDDLILSWPDNSANVKSIVGESWHRMVLAKCKVAGVFRGRVNATDFLDGLNWIDDTYVHLGTDMTMTSALIKLPLKSLDAVALPRSLPNPEVISALMTESHRKSNEGFPRLSWASFTEVNALDRNLLQNFDRIRGAFENIFNLRNVTSENIARAITGNSPASWADFTFTAEFAVAGMSVASRERTSLETKQELVFFARRLVEEMRQLQKYERDAHYNLYGTLATVLKDDFEDIQRELGAHGVTMSMFAGGVLSASRGAHLEHYFNECNRNRKCTFCGKTIDSSMPNWALEHAKFHDADPSVETSVMKIVKMFETRCGERYAEIKKMLADFDFVYPPIEFSTVMRSKKLTADELAKRIYTYRSFNQSLEGSIERLERAREKFYHTTGFDPMDAFAKNTSILSGSTPYDALIPKRPIRPHDFQRAYLEDMAAHIWAECNTTRAVVDRDNDFVFQRAKAEHPGLIVNISKLAGELGVPEVDHFDARRQRYQKLCHMIGNERSVDAVTVMFHYACGCSQTYKGAEINQIENNKQKERIGYIGMLHARKLRRIENMCKEEFSLENVLQVDIEELINDLMSSNEDRGYDDDCADADADARHDQLDTDMLRAVSDASFAGDAFSGDDKAESYRSGSPDYRSTTPLSPNMSLSVAPAIMRQRAQIRSDIMKDLRVILLCVDVFSAPSVTIHTNASKIMMKYNSSLPGSGKTTVPLLGAILLRKFKTQFSESIKRHYEIVFVCDHSLIRDEIYQRACDLNMSIKVSMIETTSDNTLRVASNFKMRCLTRNPAGRIYEEETEPEFKCADRDLFIMDSRMLVPYVLGRKEGSAGNTEGIPYGNPNAYVFFDEFGARLGDYEPMDKLARSSGIVAQIQAVFEEAMPGILILGNAPSHISLAGASMVAVDYVTSLIHKLQPHRECEVSSNVKGKIYVGSHYSYAWDERIEPWKLCPVDMFGDFFQGACEPLAKRTIGHHAAIDMRQKIRECVSSGSPIYSRLAEMENYLEFDLGIFDGESVANYAIGMLYLVMLYATKYVCPDPTMRRTCAEMQPYVDDRQITFPTGAPWPKTKFMLFNERGCVYPDVAPPEFLIGLGIPASYVAPRIPPNQPKTTFERIKYDLEESYRTRSNKITFVYDPHPLEFATAVAASIVGILPAQLESHAESYVSSAMRQDSGFEAAAASQHAQLSLHAARGTTVVGTQGHARGDGNGTGDGAGNAKGQPTKVVKMTASAVQHLQADIDSSVYTTTNPLTGNPYFLKQSGVAIESYLELYLLSMGIICMSSEESNRDIQSKYRFIRSTERALKIKIKMIICNSICAYGVNIPDATCAIISARGALTCSPGTIAQFFSRVGRSGMSHEALLRVDGVTLARMVEHMMHASSAEGSLIPVIFIALNEYLFEEARFSSWTNEVEKELAEMSASASTPTPTLVDEHLIRRVTVLITGLVAPYGLGGYFTPQIEIFAGTILSHLHEPFGISDYCTEESGLEPVTRSSYPRTDGHDTETLLRAIRFVMKRFARTRDQICFQNYSQIMCASDETGVSLTSRFITSIAKTSIQRLSL